MPVLPAHPTPADIQKYVVELEQERGFTGQLVLEKCLLFLIKITMPARLRFEQAIPLRSFAKTTAGPGFVKLTVRRVGFQPSVISLWDTRSYES